MNETIERLKKEEGFSSHLYADSQGVMTIGYGTNVEQGINARQAEALLAIALEDIEFELAKALPLYKTLDPVRSSVLVDMAYNMGVPRLMGFSNMIAALKKGDYEKAAGEMRDSKWARQVGQRARVLADAMMNGAF